MEIFVDQTIIKTFFDPDIFGNQLIRLFKLKMEKRHKAKKI